MKNLLNSILIVIFFITVSSSASYAKSLCNDKGFAVGFFNGMLVSEDDAGHNKNKLQQAVSASIKLDEPISYEVFYNETHGGMDLLEVYSQKVQELQLDGEMEKKY